MTAGTSVEITLGRKAEKEGTMNHWLLMAGVAFFGGLGSLARYGLTLGSLWLFGPSHPWGTFAANLTGCFLFGLTMGWFQSGWLSLHWKTILLTGLLGGFTTFSAFSHENFILLENRQWAAFSLHFVGQTVLGLICILIGLHLAGK